MSQFKSYIPIFKFVGAFAGIYLLLSLLYYGYTSIDWQGINYPDPVTSQVSYQTHLILDSLGRDASIINTPNLPSVSLYLGTTPVFRVIEGCNAVSVMILFVAFVLAFARSVKSTLLFIAYGIAIIYIMNLLRLVALAIIYKDYPEFKEFAHGIAFPAVIYGTTILLWIYWLRGKKTSNEI
ncbi:MAG: exosortase family protein XrtF [Nonlabens sp.]